MNEVKYEMSWYNYRENNNHNIASILPLMLAVEVWSRESSHDVNVISHDG
jgi:hypothetical protein